MRFVALSVAATAAVSSVASAQLVFTSNFESGMPAQFSGAGAVEGTQGFTGFGFGNNFLRNGDAGNPTAAASTLTLNGLPAHTALNIDFLLAIIDSWDSTNGSPAPDFFNVSVDGNPVFQATFAHASGNVSYPAPAGATLVFNTQLGFNGAWGDSAFDMSLEPALHNIAHTGSSVTISFFASGAGWQGSDDESWGIDNLSVTAVPAPASAAAVGLLGLGLARRRR